jgi:DNA polymerase III alpha subunit
MLPLFKSHYSVGKSILTASPPDKTEKGGPSSIFDIAQKNNLSEVILVEDSLVGFLESKKVADSLGIQLIFGLRLSVCDDMNKKAKKGSLECSHKIIIFAKDSSGCSLLNKIYSCAFSTEGRSIDPANLKKLYNPDHLKIAIPFYDSFLFHNLFSYKEPCILDDSFFDPVYFIEDNGLPQDIPTLEAVKSYCGDSYPMEKVKTIYYENREDFEAYQTYKCICGRGFSTKAKTLDMPNLDHCGSSEFCFESYLENESA